MFSVILTFAAAMILVAGIVMSQRSLPLDEYLPEPDEQVLSEENENRNESSQIEGQDNNVEVEINEERSSIDIQITEEPDEESVEISDESLSIRSFLYPDSNVLTQSSSKLNLTSSDTSDEITEWYESKLESYDMNVNSFVSTRTNGNVENELVSAQGSKEIRIKIEKSSGSSTVNIEVELNNV